MKRGVLWRISVTTVPEAEEAVTELLARTFGMRATSYTDIDRSRTVVSVFSQKRPGWSRARQLELKTQLRHLAQFGLNAGPGRISLARLRNENWAEAWKRHFRPITIHGRLVVKPSWHRHRPAKNQVAVILNPGLSFGTGQHPTTRFCLEQIVAGSPGRAPRSFLDIGTGSGILAIAAAKLGYSPVDAFDLDREAVRVAQANIRLNRVSGRVRVFKGDVSRLPRRCTRRYSLVCANLISSVLMSQTERIVALVQDDGLLVLAGILKEEFGRVRRSYAEHGLRLVASRTEGEWCSGTFLQSAL